MEPTTESDSISEIKVRVPEKLKESIKVLAKSNGRSTNAEIIEILSKGIVEDPEIDEIKLLMESVRVDLSNGIWDDAKTIRTSSMQKIQEDFSVLSLEIGNSVTKLSNDLSDTYKNKVQQQLSDYDKLVIKMQEQLREAAIQLERWTIQQSKQIGYVDNQEKLIERQTEIIESTATAISELHKKGLEIFDIHGQNLQANIQKGAGDKIKEFLLPATNSFSSINKTLTSLNITIEKRNKNDRANQFMIRCTFAIMIFVGLNSLVNAFTYWAYRSTAIHKYPLILNVPLVLFGLIAVAAVVFLFLAGIQKKSNE